MKFSVYTSAFNLASGIFNMPGAIKNWSRYADEIVIATTTQQEAEDIYKAVPFYELIWTPTAIKVVPSDVSLDDPLFDGKIKNAALQECSNKLVIQQDLDERLIGDLVEWEKLGENLLSCPDFKAYMLPVVDVYKDFYHYKSIGQKWYLHKKEGCFRGPVSFAKRGDGSVDTDKSDGCELIDNKGSLVPSKYEPPATGVLNNATPFIAHYGYLDLKNRQQSNINFWEKAWSNLNGKSVFVEKDLDKLNQMAYSDLPQEIGDAIKKAYE